MTSWTITPQVPLSMGFSRQEYYSGLPFSSPGDLPDAGIEHGSPALQADSLVCATREALWWNIATANTKATFFVEAGKLSTCSLPGL